MMSVEVRVSPAGERELPVLRQLMSLYLYDFSELMGLDVEEDGAFKLPDLTAYWRDRALEVPLRVGRSFPL
jgi:hypothetical protein